MDAFRTRSLAAIVGVLLITTGCNTVPTAPTAVPSAQPSPVGLSGARPATVMEPELEDALETPELVTSTTLAVCRPKFSKTATRDDFFVLTVNFASGCRWFAENNEVDGNYWDITAPDYDLRNREKYLNGYEGTGKRKLGVHFLRKIGWANHRTFVLRVCAGSCEQGSQAWTYRYSI